MTNEEIDAIIKHNRRSLEGQATFSSKYFGIFTLVFGIMGFVSLPLSWALVSFAILNFLSYVVILGGVRQVKMQRKESARLIWKKLGINHTFGSNLSLSTRQLGTEIQKIYNGKSAGELFPLRQSIRLIDTHNRQQQRLQIVENRLRELRGLQENLSSKLAQLRELGEDYPQGARNLEQINGDLAALGKVHGQIRASCARLEAIVIGVQKVAQSRELRRELEGLSAQLPQQKNAVEPAFEAQSLEEIERQIGREIETYLQLERETDEHLR